MDFIEHIEDHLKTVRFIYVECPKLISVLETELTKIQQEIQDLEHVLELGKINAIQMTKIAKDIQKVRQQRRKIKNDLELLNAIKEFATKKTDENTIGKLVGDIRKIKRNQELRVYKMRVREDLQKLLR